MCKLGLISFSIVSMINFMRILAAFDFDINIICVAVFHCIAKQIVQYLEKSFSIAPDGYILMGSAGFAVTIRNRVIKN